MKSLFALLLTTTPLFADIKTARDLMETGEFGAAYTQLIPAARAGNAEAEEMIDDVDGAIEAELIAADET